MTDIKKSRYSEEQIIGFIKQVEAGMPVAELFDRLEILDLSQTQDDEFFGQVFTSNTPNPAVPEPGSLALIGVTFAGLSMVSRRRKA